MEENTPAPAPAPEGEQMKIHADNIVVLCALPNGCVHEFVLNRQMRATLLSLLVQMHGGTPRLHAGAIEGLSTVDKAPKPEEKSKLILPPSGILKARR